MPRFRRRSRTPQAHGPERPPHDTTPRWGEPGIHGIARPREWDAVVTFETQKLDGSHVELTALADGTVVLEDGDFSAGHDDFELVARALSAQVEPPFRAVARAQGSGRWAAAANRIEVVELPEATAGDEIVLSWNGSERILKVDDMPAFGSLPELERLGAARHRQYVVRAIRLDGRHWEVAVSPL